MRVFTVADDGFSVNCIEDFHGENTMHSICGLLSGAYSALFFQPHCGDSVYTS